MVALCGEECNLRGLLRPPREHPLDGGADRFVGAVDTADPAAGTAHAFKKFLASSFDPAVASVDKFGVFNPADPLVAGEGRKTVPYVHNSGICCQCLSQVSWYLVHNSI
jgi:hypothetical protein